jgi:3-oxoadipate enol-lactonase
VPAELTWTRELVAADGEDIYFESTEPAASDGTIVLGHGGAGCHATWFQQVPALARRHRVITWDTRGFGCSSFRTGRLDAARCADDLAAVLRAADVAEPVNLVAQSMGGWWITAFALARPDQVRSLTYAATTGGLFTPALDRHFRQAMAARSAGAERLGQHVLLGPRLRAERPELAFLYQQLGTLQKAPPALTGQAIRERFDVGALRGLRIPALFIGGADDHIFPPRLVAEVAELAGGRPASIPGTGHSAFFEDARAWNRVVLEFVTDGV